LKFNPQILKQLREKKELNRTNLVLELYKKYNYRITDQTISNWENGIHVPDVNTLAKLASFFEVSIEYFFDNKQDKTVMS